MTKLILIRGLPGSGKSTLAHKLMSEAPYAHFEADMYFVKAGQYKFKPKLIKAAHEWCRLNTGVSLSLDRNTIVCNTFTRIWEMKAYFKMAKALKVEVEVLECTGEYENIHNVPVPAIQRMKRRWQFLPQGVHYIDR